MTSLATSAGSSASSPTEKATIVEEGSNSTTTSASYTWTAPYGGSWSTVSNWQANNAAATAAPGAGSTVLIANSRENDITGSGSAGNLTVSAYTVLFGTVSVTGDTYVGPSSNGTNVYTGALELDHATLTTGVLGIVNGVQVGTGSHLSAGTITAAGLSMLKVQDGGTVQTNVLTNGAQGVAPGVDPFIFVDGASSLEVGTLGSATLGALTIDSSVNVALDASVAANVIVNGQLSITDGGMLNLDVAPDEISAGSYSVTGAGTINVNEMSLLSVGGDSVSAAINFAGPDATLAVTSPATISAAISGFAAGDQILFGHWVTGVSWSQTNTSSGTLTLRDNGNVVGHLILDGNYSGETFHLGAASAGANSSVYGGAGGEALTVRTIGTAPAVPAQINGTTGHDTLVALASGETLTGGAGNDYYRLKGLSNLTVRDTSSDLNGATLTGLANATSLTLDVTDLTTGTAQAEFVKSTTIPDTAMLTLSDGTHVAVLDIFSTGLGTVSVTASNFSFASDGHGGTNVTFHL